MTKELKTELTKDGGALNEAEKSIEEGKNNLQGSIDDIIQSVSPAGKLLQKLFCLSSLQETFLVELNCSYDQN